MTAETTVPPPRRLWREITVVLAIKIALLTAIWALWFSHPETRHMSLPTAAVESRVLGTH